MILEKYENQNSRQRTVAQLQRSQRLDEGKEKKASGKKKPQKNPTKTKNKFNINKHKEKEQEAKIIIPYEEHKEFSL